MYEIGIGTFTSGDGSDGGGGSVGRGTTESDATETDSASAKSAESDVKYDPETQANDAVPDAKQIGGDPRKGLFARLKRIFA